MQCSNEGKYYRKNRKKELSDKGVISCNFCRFHRGENATHHKERVNKYKNINRETIRKNLNMDSEELYFENVNEN